MLHCKKIIVNMLCLYVYVISFSTSVRSNQTLSLFVDQFAGCLNQGMVGTDSMSWLFNLGKSWPFFNILSSRPIKNFWMKVIHFPVGYWGMVQKRYSHYGLIYLNPTTSIFLSTFETNQFFAPWKFFQKFLRMKAVRVSPPYILIKHL